MYKTIAALLLMIRVAGLCNLILDYPCRHDERARNRLVLRTTLIHVSTPPKSKQHDGQGRNSGMIKCFRKIQSSERCCEMVFVFSVTRGCAPRICLWPPRCDKLSGVLIGADGTRRSDWLERVQAVGVLARSDRWPACKKRSIARCRRLLQTLRFPDWPSTSQ